MKLSCLWIQLLCIPQGNYLLSISFGINQAGIANFVERDFFKIFKGDP